METWPRSCMFYSVNQQCGVSVQPQRCGLPGLVWLLATRWPPPRFPEPQWAAQFLRQRWRRLSQPPGCWLLPFRAGAAERVWWGLREAPCQKAQDGPARALPQRAQHGRGLHQHQNGRLRYGLQRFRQLHCKPRATSAHSAAVWVKTKRLAPLPDRTVYIAAHWKFYSFFYVHVYIYVQNLFFFFFLLWHQWCLIVQTLILSSQELITAIYFQSVIFWNPWWAWKVNTFTPVVPKRKRRNLFSFFFSSRVPPWRIFSIRDVLSGTYALLSRVDSKMFRNCFIWSKRLFVSGATVPLEGALLWAAVTSERSSLLSIYIQVALRLRLQTLHFEKYILQFL